jgi:hypothetical protein
MSTIYLDEVDDPVNICYDNIFKAVFTYLRNTHAKIQRICNRTQ